MAYFANSSTGAGVLGEALTAALNVNAMLWRTSPAATELELLTLDWLRQMLGLPETILWGHRRHRIVQHALRARRRARDASGAADTSGRDVGKSGHAEGGGVLLGGSAFERGQGGDDARVWSELAQEDSHRRSDCAWMPRRSMRR